MAWYILYGFGLIWNLFSLIRMAARVAAQESPMSLEEYGVMAVTSLTCGLMIACIAKRVERGGRE